MTTKVAQIWFTTPDGIDFPYSQKFYSKIGVAENLANKYNRSSVYKFFVKVYNLEFVGDIKND